MSTSEISSRWRKIDMLLAPLFYWTWRWKTWNLGIRPNLFHNSQASARVAVTISLAPLGSFPSSFLPPDFKLVQSDSLAFDNRHLSVEWQPRPSRKYLWIKPCLTLKLRMWKIEPGAPENLYQNISRLLSLLTWPSFLFSDPHVHQP